jgi:hypothetical protein
MDHWMPINEGALEPNSLYIFANAEGSFLLVSGQQKEEAMKDYPQLTACRLFCEAPTL